MGWIWWEGGIVRIVSFLLISSMVWVGRGCLVKNGGEDLGND